MRRMKVIDYGPLYWDDHWPRKKPTLYPPFEQWRREAESYTPDELVSEDQSSASSPS